jgi:hypothetical protein
LRLIRRTRLNVLPHQFFDFIITQGNFLFFIQ